MDYMKNKLLKSVVTFLVIFGIVFSNIPYSATSFLIDSYIKTSGVVDKIWKIQQNNDGSIIDNFASVRTIAEKFKIHEAMAAANYQAVGTAVSGTTSAVSVAWPAHAINDVALLFVETAGGSTITIPTPNGFTQVANSPQTTGSGTAGTKLAVYWARATSAAMAAPSVKSSADHIYAVIVTFRGVITTGDPVDATAGGVKATASTAVSATGVTTTAVNEIIAIAVTKNLDATTAFTSGQTNANLTGILERADAGTNSGGGGGISVTTGAKATAGATGNMAITVTSSINAFLTVALKPQLSTTTLATGTDPSATSIAPGAAATDVDGFSLTSSTGTETISSVTVNLSTNSGIGTLAITNSANTVLGSTASPVTGSNTIAVAGMTAGTTLTNFKVRITPLAHTSMPIPPGGSYSITAPVTAWVGTGGYVHAGSDTNTNALTIDNASPAATTSASATPGNGQIQVSWANPGDADFSKVIIYCKTSAITESPTEGTDPTVDGTACDGTARVKYSGTASPQTFTGLTNGTTYYFRIYTRDTNGNFTAYASSQRFDEFQF